MENPIKDHPGNPTNKYPGNPTNDRPANPFNDRPRNHLSDQPRNQLNDHKGNKLNDQKGNQLNDQKGNQFNSQPRNQPPNRSMNQYMDQTVNDGRNPPRSQQSGHFNNQQMNQFNDQPIDKSMNRQKSMDRFFKDTPQSEQPHNQFAEQADNRQRNESLRRFDDLPATTNKQPPNCSWEKGNALNGDGILGAPQPSSPRGGILGVFPADQATGASVAGKRASGGFLAPERNDDGNAVRKSSTADEAMGGILGSGPAAPPPKNNLVRSSPAPPAPLMSTLKSALPDVSVHRDVVRTDSLPAAQRKGLRGGYVIHERFYLDANSPLVKKLPLELLNKLPRLSDKKNKESNEPMRMNTTGFPQQEAMAEIIAPPPRLHSDARPGSLMDLITPRGGGGGSGGGGGGSGSGGLDLMRMNTNIGQPLNTGKGILGDRGGLGALVRGGNGGSFGDGRGVLGPGGMGAPGRGGLDRGGYRF